MEKTNEDVLNVIIIGTIVIVILAIFVLMFFVLFVKKKKGLEAENKQLQVNFAEALLQTQLEIQEQTLLHISREIHDNIGQVLSLVSLNLHTINGSDPEKIASTSGLVTKAIEDLRNLSKSMNSDRIQQVGIKEAIKQEMIQLERSGSFKTTFADDHKKLELSPDKTLILFRMIQEVINNIIKHAGADQVNVELKNGNIISIGDNGKGFDTATVGFNGIGLQNLRQRALLINAGLDIISSASGTTVKFILKK